MNYQQNQKDLEALYEQAQVAAFFNPLTRLPDLSRSSNSTPTHLRGGSPSPTMGSSKPVAQNESPKSNDSASNPNKTPSSVLSQAIRTGANFSMDYLTGISPNASTRQADHSSLEISQSQSLSPTHVNKSSGEITEEPKNVTVQPQTVIDSSIPTMTDAKEAATLNHTEEANQEEDVKEEISAPVNVEEEVAPVKVEEEVAPVNVEEEVAPVNVEEEVAPVKVEEEVAPVKVEEEVAPVEVKEEVAPVEVVEEVAPVEQEIDPEEVVFDAEHLVAEVVEEKSTGDPIEKNVVADAEPAKVIETLPETQEVSKEAPMEPSTLQNEENAVVDQPQKSNVEQVEHDQQNDQQNTQQNEGEKEQGKQGNTENQQVEQPEETQVQPQMISPENTNENQGENQNEEQKENDEKEENTASAGDNQAQPTLPVVILTEEEKNKLESQNQQQTPGDGNPSSVLITTPTEPITGPVTGKGVLDGPTTGETGTGEGAKPFWTEGKMVGVGAVVVLLILALLYKLKRKNRKSAPLIEKVEEISEENPEVEV